MPDRDTSVAALRALVARFAAERRWARYHTPKNLAMSVAIEAAELMEHFQWTGAPPRRRRAVEEEIADVAAYLFALCNALGVDLSTAMRRKMRRNAVKYPVRSPSLPSASGRALRKGASR